MIVFSQRVTGPMDEYMIGGSSQRSATLLNPLSRARRSAIGGRQPKSARLAHSHRSYALSAIPAPEAAVPTCPFRKLYPNILMMQPGQDWDGDNDTGPLDCPMQGRIFL